jgi:aspartate-semialdehyde dehydrogenase
VNIAIIGATGLVGQTFIKIIEEEKIPYDNLILYGSKRSAGKQIIVNGKKHIVSELTTETVEAVEYALFSAGNQVSKQFAQLFVDLGAIVIDNSSAYRMAKNIHLTVPEININIIDKKPQIIANPNCSTIQAVLPLHYINSNNKIRSIRYTTYQSVSGSGQKGIAELENTRKGLAAVNYPFSISDNVICQIDEFINNEMTKEEKKMIEETQKILATNCNVDALCVRVPVPKSHMVVVDFQLSTPLEIAQIEKLLNNKTGLILKNDNINQRYPINEMSNGNNNVYVGRIRKLSGQNWYSFICIADNIRKGAAANAVQILQKMEEKT